MDAAFEAKMRALLDKKDIEEVLVRYCRGIDRADIELISSCYHDNAIEEHGGLFTGPASDYVAKISANLPKAKIMNHMVTGVLIELEGDQATVESHLLVYSRMKKDGEKFDVLTLARTVDRFERRAGEWRIARRRLAWEWNHEMPFAESWGRGLITADPSRLVRGAKKPHDILYSV